nr:MAG TPA: hypothetical protein [Bacteriophage sp.]
MVSLEKPCGKLGFLVLKHIYCKKMCQLVTSD